MDLLREYIKELLELNNPRRYFAYGSNMDQSRLHRRSNAGPPCVLDTHLNLPVVGRALLDDHTVGFAGHSETWGGPTATLVPSPGNSVVGVLYLTDPKQEEALSCFENSDGHRTLPTHDKIDITVTGEDGILYDCYTFVHKEESDPMTIPPPGYARALEDAHISRDLRLSEGSRIVPTSMSMSEWESYKKKNKTTAKAYDKKTKSKWKITHGPGHKDAGKTIKGNTGLTYKKAKSIQNAFGGW